MPDGNSGDAQVLPNGELPMNSRSMPPHPVAFECSCGHVHHAPDRQIPVGWSKRAGHVWCEDCTRAGIAARVSADARRAA